MSLRQSDPARGRVLPVRSGRDYERVAALVGLDPDELQRADVSRGSSCRRWYLPAGDGAAGMVRASLRPDDRWFLTLDGENASAYPALLDAAIGELGRPLFAHADAADQRMRAAFERAGLVPDLLTERFRIRFDGVSRRIDGAEPPSGVVLVSAATCNEARLFALDNSIRNEVPGLSGWRGDLVMFRAELAEAPPFDPAAYLVAVEQSSRFYVGLARIWRNAAGPRLGLIGVITRYRRSRLAASLLAAVLRAAAGWGYGTFVTEASPSNRAVYPAIVRAGGTSEGSIIRMRLS